MAEVPSLPMIRSPSQLVDGLVDHVQLRPLGEAGAQGLAYLLRTPSQVQTLLDEGAQFQTLGDLPRLGAGAPAVGPGLGRVRAVVAGSARVDRTVAADLPADRGGAAAQLGGDLPDRGLLPQPVGDMDPVGFPEVAGRPRRRHRRNWWRPDRPAGRGAAITPPLSRPVVDPDDPARFHTAHALLHELKVNAPLLSQPTTSLVDRPVPNLEVHRTPQLGCCDDS